MLNRQRPTALPAPGTPGRGGPDHRGEHDCHPVPETSLKLGERGESIDQPLIWLREGRFATAWRAISAVVGTLLGLLPHVLHHAGLIFGAALVTGAVGNLVFAALGLLFSVPLLRRLHHRFQTWKAPAIAIAIFLVLFSLSAFVVGPAISGDSSGDAPSQIQPTNHNQHVGH